LYTTLSGQFEELPTNSVTFRGAVDYIQIFALARLTGDTAKP
jgi:hypothetical protein